MPDPKIDHGMLTDKALELDDKVESTGFNSLTPSEKAFYCIWLFTTEVNSGGYDRYYRYHGANLANETVQALKLVGRFPLADNLSEANQMFSTIDFSSINEREEFLEKMGPEDHKKLKLLFSPVFNYPPYPDLWMLMHSNASCYEALPAARRPA